jgi:heptaprenyl diphosphate synthase/octaprenyl-diphosphate synthase
VALMVGDYLFALAAGEMALAPDARVIGYYAQAVQRICEGQLAPVLSLAPLEQAEGQYFYHIGGASAALFEAACRAGMASGGGAPQQIETLGRFGYELGLAHRIVRDVLDYTEDAPERPAGAALRRGSITLPLIYAAASGNGALAGLNNIPGDDEQRIAQAVAEVRQLGAGRALKVAHDLAGRALAQLETFPEGSARRTLAALAEAALHGEA